MYAEKGAAAAAVVVSQPVGAHAVGGGANQHTQQGPTWTVIGRSAWGGCAQSKHKVNNPQKAAPALARDSLEIMKFLRNEKIPEGTKITCQYIYIFVAARSPFELVDALHLCETLMSAHRHYLACHYTDLDGHNRIASALTIAPNSKIQGTWLFARPDQAHAARMRSCAI